MFQLSLMIKKQWPDLLTLLTSFYEFSVARDPLSKSKNRDTCENHCTYFFDRSVDRSVTKLFVRARVIWHVFQLQFMIRKPRHDLLPLSRTFYDLSASCNLFSKAKIGQFSTGGTEGLKSERLIFGSESLRARVTRFSSINQISVINFGHLLIIMLMRRK